MHEELPVVEAPVHTVLGHQLNPFRIVIIHARHDNGPQTSVSDNEHRPYSRTRLWGSFKLAYTHYVVGVLQNGITQFENR